MDIRLGGAALEATLHCVILSELNFVDGIICVIEMYTHTVPR